MMPLLVKAVRIVAYLAALVHSQHLLEPQTNTWNSAFSLTEAQINEARLSPSAAHNLNIALRHERTGWATCSVLSDPFYASIPANASSAPAGSVLKVEHFTNTTLYTLPPTLALSRLIYQSKTLNGSLVPVSAFVLWPYRARGGADAAPLVSWAHGTSGIFAECAPSHLRNLLYHFAGPYALALAGYAVVATDYAGLGVARDAAEQPIAHEYTASPAAGNDVLYAARAAHAAFPDQTTEDFAVMGHSQGGGAAWAAAQTQLEAGIGGYLGAVAVSPVTSVADVFAATGSSLGLIQGWKALARTFPDMPLDEVLTARGQRLAKLAGEAQACYAALGTMVADALAADPSEPLTVDDWFGSRWARTWSGMTAVGGKDFAGPLLVLQGSEDEATLEPLTTKYVNLTCERFPESELTYVVAEGVGHIPTMYATQQLWLEWLDERFRAGSRGGDGEGRGKGGCSRRTIGGETPVPGGQYQAESNWYMSFAVDAYQV
ncbi:hypothetical protein N3K66_000293 [Trichothecium roseum]|uniref:Uncharacterized protein n=1 Tax=Trichothecium roseum TaxID=47278 RepID=A0ACC0VC38_9HYPO|nr:hypothetical protein N3K66_000293 [Trichothecium roseum]